MPGGIKGLAGSLLIVMFSYAGFEIIGLAASEAENPRKTVPKAIGMTVLFLVGLYILSVSLVLPLVPTAELGAEVSPMVAALGRQGYGWVGTILNFVLITAILSTMLAAMFGLGRMMRSLAEENLAPQWLKDEREVPYRGILFSGLSMLVALGLGFLVPSVYVFLISSGGFALLFTYAVIVASQIRYRKKYGCPPEGKCQMPGYPYAPWIVLIVLFIAILSMPFVSGQTSGLITGILMVALYSLVYWVVNKRKVSFPKQAPMDVKGLRTSFSTEISEELSQVKSTENQEKTLASEDDNSKEK